jgi:hypothetical protein
MMTIWGWVINRGNRGLRPLSYRPAAPSEAHCPVHQQCLGNGDDLIVECVEFGVVVKINVVNRQALCDGHSLPV